jgi:ABC-type lipoprotein export system ATPase subunit
MVTHDPRMIGPASRLIVMNDGAIVSDEHRDDEKQTFTTGPVEARR